MDENTIVLWDQNGVETTFEKSIFNRNRRRALYNVVSS